MKYHNITKDDMLNGYGLRVVLWLSGCEHHCKGCQNPITWNPDDGLVFDEDAKQEIFDQLEHDYIDGLTVSGGDSLYPANRESVYWLCKEVKEKYPDKTIWLYTGYLWEEIKDLPVMEYVDVVCDGKFVEELKDNNIEWVGSSNQRVIKIKGAEVKYEKRSGTSYRLYYE